MAAAKRPQTAMILAAGKGTRMRPLTDNLPKPMLQVAGRPLIDYVLDPLIAMGVERCVVNVHHCPDPLRRHLAKEKRLEIIISDETDALLDSGGGIRKALPNLGKAPFYVLNGDAPLFTEALSALDNLAVVQQETQAAAVLLLTPTRDVPDFEGPGDYDLPKSGVPERRPGPAPADYVFTGAQILHPDLFLGAPAGPAFSSIQLFDAAAQAGTLRGAVYSGLWLQINTTDGLRTAETQLANLKAGASDVR